jgi:hypothetical protein
MKIILSWLLYFIGDITSRCITMKDSEFNYKLACFYQWSMAKSSDFQGKSKYGPWRDVNKKTG